MTDQIKLNHWFDESYETKPHRVVAADLEDLAQILLDDETAVTILEKKVRIAVKVKLQMLGIECLDDRQLSQQFLAMGLTG